jgi:hypothetical protein
MLLDKSTRTITIQLGEAKTTSEVVVVSQVQDFVQEQSVPITLPDTSNGTAVKTIIPAPKDNTARFIKEILIYNADTVQHEIKVAFVTELGTSLILDTLLGAKQTYQYTSDRGWQIIYPDGTYAPLNSPAFTGNGSIAGAWTVGGALTLTAGQIKFPATQNPSSDANTLDDYEEGSWIVLDASGASLTLNTESYYVKIGLVVIVASIITYPSTASGAAAALTGLPFTASNTSQNCDGFYSGSGSIGQSVCYTVGRNSVNIFPRTTSNVTIANSTLSTKFLSVNGSYRAAA